jgi:very-short-patch-repair endonuclease
MRSAKELKKYKSRLKRKPTKEELYVLAILEQLNIEFKFQPILGFYIMDFLLPTKMINIEIDGKIHDFKKSYDNKRDTFTMKCGFAVIKIKNEDVFEYNFKSIMELPDKDVRLFRRGLALANAYRSKAINPTKKK